MHVETSSQQWVLVQVAHASSSTLGSHAGSPVSEPPEPDELSEPCVVLVLVVWVVSLVPDPELSCASVPELVPAALLLSLVAG